MSKTMTPSNLTPITAGQIGKIQDLLGAGLRKSGLLSKPIQQVLETEGDALVKEFVGLLRKRVEAHSEMIVRHFKVDRTKTPKQMIDATGRKKYVDDEVLMTMPTDGPGEGDLYFFPAKRYIPARELAALYESFGLVPDPYAQMQVNTDEQSFADEHSNGVQWQNDQSQFCYAACSRWVDGGRSVDVDHSGGDWDDDWWFAGRRKN